MLRSAILGRACCQSLPPGPSISTDWLVLPTSLPFDLEQVLKWAATRPHPLAHSACLVHLSPGTPGRLLWLAKSPGEVLLAYLSSFSSFCLAEPPNSRPGHNALAPVRGCFSNRSDVGACRSVRKEPAPPVLPS